MKIFLDEIKLLGFKVIILWYWNDRKWISKEYESAVGTLDFLFILIFIRCGLRNSGIYITKK